MVDNWEAVFPRRSNSATMGHGGLRHHLRRAMGRYRDILPFPELRNQLRARKTHYHYRLSYGRFLGYLKPPDHAPAWVAVGNAGNGKYLTKVVGKPDDKVLADGKCILTFSQARDAASAWLSHPERCKLLNTEPIRYRGELSVCPIGDRYTVGHALKDYLAWKRQEGVSQSGMRPSVCAANAYIVPLLADVPAADLTPEILRMFLTTVAVVPRNLIGVRQPDIPKFKCLDPDTQMKRKKVANMAFGVLCRALNRAWSSDKIVSNDAWRGVKRFKVPAAEPPFIPGVEHVRALLQVSDPCLRNLIQFGYLTGCALDEAVKVSANWISLDEGTLCVPAWASSRGSRTFPISSQAIRFLSDALSLNGPHELLFRNQHGLPYEYETARDHFVVARKTAGLTKQFKFRSLRDAHAVSLLSAGLSIAFIARQIGVSNEGALCRYTHCVDDFIDRDVRAHFPFKFDIHHEGQDH